jgi:uncharacterized membrane protein
MNKKEAQRPAFPVLCRPSGRVLIRIATLLLIPVLIAGMILFSKSSVLSVNSANSMYVRAKVTQMVKNDTSPDPATGGRVLGEQELRIQILEGTHKGENMNVENDLSALHNVDAHQGSRIVVRIDTQTNGSYTASVYNYDRTGVLFGLAAFFLLLLCIVGGRKGIQSIFGLLFTMACVVFLMLPMVLKGGSPVWSAILVAVLTTAVCFILLDGINGKTVSAALGTVVGVVFAGLFASLAGMAASMNGFNMQEAESLLLQAGKNRIQIDGLLVGGIIISALGAVMDIAISISSSLYELHQANPKFGSGELFRSAMNIGRDAMGTMANTLILAFVGSSLNTLVLIDSYGIPFSQLINTDLIGIEILQGIAGSIGIVLTVPAVAWIASQIVRHQKPALKLRKAG